MVCANPSEARFIEQLSESNAGFRANDNECDSKEVTESMIDQLGDTRKAHYASVTAMGMTSRSLSMMPSGSMLNSMLPSTADQPIMYATLEMCQDR